MLQQTLRLLNAAAPQVRGGRQACKSSKHARQMHRVHTGHTRRLGDAGLTAERVVEVLTGESEPCGCLVWR